MSFKRDGDDTSQLNILKKRRVADLLSHFIPEDEASLMKNGRYTCLVCTSRPIFDTVDMLTVHRKGRKHLEGMKWFYGKKSQLRNEIAKRRHSSYVQEEENSQSERQEPSSSAPLLVQTRKITHHALLKTVPYNSRHKKMRFVKLFSTSISSFGSRPVAFRSVPPAQSANLSFSTPSVKGSGSEPAEPPPPSEARMRPAGSEEAAGAGPPSSYTADKVNGLKPFRQKAEQQAPVTAQRRRELEHYLQLKAAGWMQDRSGKWVKDENVEFDSEEDEPPPLAPRPPGEEDD